MNACTRDKVARSHLCEPRRSVERPRPRRRSRRFSTCIDVTAVNSKVRDYFKREYSKTREHSRENSVKKFPQESVRSGRLASLSGLAQSSHHAGPSVEACTATRINFKLSCWVLIETSASKQFGLSRAFISCLTNFLLPTTPPLTSPFTSIKSGCASGTFIFHCPTNYITYLGVLLTSLIYENETINQIIRRVRKKTNEKFYTTCFWPPLHEIL